MVCQKNISIYAADTEQFTLNMCKNNCQCHFIFWREREGGRGDQWIVQFWWGGGLNGVVSWYLKRKFINKIFFNVIRCFQFLYVTLNHDIFLWDWLEMVLWALDQIGIWIMESYIQHLPRFADVSVCMKQNAVYLLLLQHLLLAVTPIC